MDISALLHGSVLEILIAVVSFIGVLSVIVFVHEYGHFKTARLCGVRVGEVRPAGSCASDGA